MSLNVIVRPRAGGKTTESIRWVLDDIPSRVLAVPTVHTAKDLLARHPELTHLNFITPEDRYKMRGRQAELALDGLEDLLWQTFGQLPAFATVNGLTIR